MDAYRNFFLLLFRVDCASDSSPKSGSLSHCEILISPNTYTARFSEATRGRIHCRSATRSTSAEETILKENNSTEYNQTHKEEETLLNPTGKLPAFQLSEHVHRIRKVQLPIGNFCFCLALSSIHLIFPGKTFTLGHDSGGYF